MHSLEEGPELGRYAEQPFQEPTLTAIKATGHAGKADPFVVKGMLSHLHTRGVSALAKRKFRTTEVQLDVPKQGGLNRRQGEASRR